VNQYTSSLEGAERRENVVAADDFSTNVEAVVALEPDLVLAPNVTPVDTVARLRAANQTVYHFGEARSIEDVYAKTLLTGRLTGNCAGAAERTARMRGRIERVRDAVAGAPRPSVIYPLGGGVVAGNGTFLHELITTAGGRNLAAEAGIEGYRQISAEEIVARQPDWLILNDGLPRSAIQLDAYNETPAVRDDQIVRVNPNDANQPAPRIALVVEQLARAFHPEAMTSPNETATATPTEDPATPTATAGQPGFGVAAGVLALVVTLLAIRRPRSR
jgi:iron complex transport system substrate-binding protein